MPCKKNIIIITGSPGTGKSYTAKVICKRYPFLRLLSYDDIKESFWDTYGFSNKEEKKVIDEKSLTFFYSDLEKLMTNQEQIILEYPFYQRHKPVLKKLIEEYDYYCITILLFGDPQILYKRACQRDLSGNRHPGHLLCSYKKGMEPDYSKCHVPSQVSFWEALKGKNYDLQLGTCIKIDVSDFANIDYSKIWVLLDNCFSGMR